MTAPGGSFVAEIGADISGLSAEINAGLRAVQNFARDVNTTAQAIKPIAVTPKVDISLALAGLKALGISVKELAADASGVRVFQAVGQDIENASGIFKRLGVDVRVISAEMAEVEAAAKQVTAAVVPAAREMQKLAGPDIGRKMRAVGAAMREMATSTTASGRSLVSVNTQAGLFAGKGQRMASAAVAIGFGLEGIARGGDAAEGGIRQALRAGASFAALFGTGGLIVAGVAVSTAAIVDLFSRSNDAMRASAKTFREEITRLIDDVDQLGLEKLLQEVELGKRSSGKALLGGWFKGGLKEMEALQKAITRVMPDLERLLQIEVAASKPIPGQALQGLQASQKESPLAQTVRQNRDFLRELGTQIKDANKKKAELTDALLNPLPTPILPRGLTENKIELEISADAKEAKREIAEFTARVQALLEAERQVRETSGLVLPGLPAALVSVYDVALNKLRALNNQQSAVAVSLRALVSDLQRSGEIVASRLSAGELKLGDIGITKGISEAIDKDLAKSLAGLNVILPITFAPPDQGEIAGLKEAVQRVMDARGLVDISKFTGSSAFVAETKAQLEIAETTLRQFATRAAGALEEPGQSAEQLTKRIEALAAAMGILDTASKRGLAFTQLAEAVHEVTTGARGLLQVASAVGAIGDEARKSAEDVLALADSVATLTKGLATGDLAAIIAGTVGTIGSLISASGIGESPGEKERKQLQRENNDRVAELTRALKGATITLGNLQNIQRVVSDPRIRTFADNARGNRNGFGRSFGDLELERLHKGLAAAGLSYAEVAALAKDLGIALRDSAGNLIGGAFGQLDEAIQLTIRELTTFKNTLQDNRSIADLTLDINDTTDPASVLRSWVESAKAVFPKFFDSVFAGVDLLDPKAVKETMKAFLAALVLDKDLLAKLGISKEDFLALFGGVEGALDSFADSVNAATESMRNVPEWFKIESFRFNAADAVSRSPMIPLPTPPQEPIHGGGVDNPAIPGGLRGGAGNTINGGVHVTIVESKSPRETAQEVIEVVRMYGRATGDQVLQRWTVSLP